MCAKNCTEKRCDVFEALPSLINMSLAKSLRNKDLKLNQLIFTHVYI